MGADKVRVNLGCGHKVLPGWLNVDMSGPADVLADIRFWDPPGPCSEVLCVHVIEHLEWRDAVLLVRRARDWLDGGGRLVVEMPDRLKCLSVGGLEGAKGIMGGRSKNKAEWADWLAAHQKDILALAKKAQFEEILSKVPKAFRLPGEAHQHVWSASELVDELERAGFVEVEDVGKPVTHGKRVWRDMRVEATA